MHSLMKVIGLCVFSLLLSVNVFAVDGVRIAAGSGEDSTDVYKISLLQDFDKTWFDGKVKGHWELGISHWDASKGPVDNLQGLSFAPVFVYGFKQLSAGQQFYVDASLGVIYVTESKIGKNDLGSHWLFDARFGLGFRFGSDGRHDLNVSWRHSSNASLGDTNEGFDSSQVAYIYHF